MATFNKVILMGNVTRDPELRYTPKGTAVTEIGMAINERYKDDGGNVHEKVIFVDVTLWGRTAEIACQYLTKGRPAHIEGKLDLEKWTDKSGQNRQKLKVVGESLQLLGTPPGQREDDGEGDGEYAPPARPQQRPVPSRNGAHSSPTRPAAPRREERPARPAAAQPPPPPEEDPGDIPF